MLSKGRNGRDVMAMVWLEDLVPKDHLLRKIDAAVASGDRMNLRSRVVEGIRSKNNTNFLSYGAHIGTQ